MCVCASVPAAPQVHHIRTKLPLHRFATSPAVPIIEMGCIGKHKARWKLGLARTTIIALMLADWIVRIIEMYVVEGKELPGSLAWH